MNFTQITKFLIKNKKSVFFISFLLLLTSSNSAFAAESSGGGIIDIVNYILKIAGTVLALMTELVSWFMTPAWTSGRAIGIETNLHELWLIVSNIVYLMFAAILVIIAVMNIIGKTGKWEMKQALPKFIIGLLIVPFSWLIVGAIVGFSSVLSAALLGLPMDEFPAIYDDGLKPIPACQHYVFNIGQAQGDSQQAIECKKKSTLDKIIQGDNGVFHILSVYTYGVMRLDANGKLNVGDIANGNIKDLASLGLKGLFDVIFVLVFFLLIVALGLALFVRGLVIWVFMVFSPFFGLMYYFDDGKPMEALSKNLSFKKFVDLAMMPVYVSGALAFGLLFILVAGKSMNGECSEGSSTLCVKDNKVEFGGIILEFNGSFGASGEKAAELLGGFKGAFGALILQIFGIMILWMAVMGAIKTSDVTASVVQPIEQFGNSVGSVIKKAPTYLPIIPGPDGMMSPAALGQMGSTLAQTINSNIAGKGAAWGQQLGDTFTGQESSDFTKFMNTFETKLNDLTGKDKHDKVVELLQHVPKNGFKTQAEFDRFKRALIKLGADKKLVEDLQMGDDKLKTFGYKIAEALKKGHVTGTGLTDGATVNKTMGRNFDGTSSSSDSSKAAANAADSAKKTTVAEIKDPKKLAEAFKEVVKTDSVDMDKLLDLYKRSSLSDEKFRELLQRYDLKEDGIMYDSNRQKIEIDTIMKYLKEHAKK